MELNGEDAVEEEIDNVCTKNKRLNMCGVVRGRTQRCR